VNFHDEDGLVAGFLAC